MNMATRPPPIGTVTSKIVGLRYYPGKYYLFLFVQGGRVRTNTAPPTVSGRRTTEGGGTVKDGGKGTTVSEHESW